MSIIITSILRRFNSCSSLSLFKHYFVTIKKFELDMKKVLVTGISGFIGHQCAAELLKNGYSVKGTVRDLGKKDEVINGIKKEIDPVENLEFVNLDLLNDKGWDDAMKDCEYVLHVASPFFMKEPSNEDEYIKPACEGTIRVLKAAQKAKIKRIVLTSSVVSMTGKIYDSNEDIGIVNAESWTDTNSKNINTYMKSKTLAEKGAWDFVNNQSDKESLELVVVCPGFVMGPTLTGNISGASLESIHRMLTGHFKMSMIPPIGLPMSDVRDIAKIHVLALTEKEAKSKRLIPTTSRAYSMMEIAKILKDNGYNKVSTKKGPVFMIKIMSLFDKEVKGMLPMVGKSVGADNSETKKIFNWEPIPFEKTILDTASSIKNLI
jgi:dihydroflavonol-4-reductase